MPVLYAGGESVGQSTAIYHYVATECGLMGSSTMEQAQIIGVAEHLKEVSPLLLLLAVLAVLAVVVLLLLAVLVLIALLLVSFR